MINDNDNDFALFTVAQHAGRERIVFTTFATLKAGIPGQTPLWWFEPRDEVELTSLAVWLGEHRDLWPTWRKLAELGGIQALADEISRLWSLGPIESCHSMMMTSPSDDPREVAFLAMLVTRSSELVRHRFASALHRNVLTDWYLRDIEANAAFLLFEGCLIGPKHLGRVLDKIANAEMADRRQARARRASRPRRKAA